MDTEVFDFLYICDLNEDQGHPNWYQNVELCSPYHQSLKEIGL